MLLATTYPGVLLATGVFILSKTLLRTLIISLASKRASPGISDTVPAGVGDSGHAVGQGATMGLSNSFVSLGRIVGPVLGGTLLDANLSLPYLSGAIILLAGFLFSFLIPRGLGQGKQMGMMEVAGH